MGSRRRCDPPATAAESIQRGLAVRRERPLPSHKQRSLFFAFDESGCDSLLYWLVRPSWQWRTKVGPALGPGSSERGPLFSVERIGRQVCGWTRRHKKRPRCCPRLGPRTTHCEREELCAILKANVTVAACVQTPIELKRKKRFL